MKEEMISFETAKLANEKEFREPCANVVSKKGYDNSLNYTGEVVFQHDDVLAAVDNTGEEYYFAPTQSLLQKWLRDKYNIDVEVCVFTRPDYHVKIVDRYAYVHYMLLEPENNELVFDTYEKALEHGLYEALKLTK